MSFTSLQWGEIFGGFGLFMYGITTMGDGLKSAAGDRLKEYIDKYCSSPFKGLIMGLLLTILMQSSSASIAITIGLVRAGLMTFIQAAGIVMGANIGTTVTSFLISLDIEKYAMWIMFAGTALICFTKRRKLKDYGNIILGFGLIFFGMNAMGTALSGVKDMPEFQSFALAMSSNHWLSMLVGTALTGVVQSSAATIGIVQKLYQAGALSLEASLPFMFGANIGTCVTGLLASIGGSLSGRRTAALHLSMNIVASVIGMLVLAPYTSFIAAIGADMNPMMQIAVANIIFKTVTTLCFMPFLNKLCDFICRIVPGNEPARIEVDVDSLDPDLINTFPAAAISAAGQAIGKMSLAVEEDLRLTRKFLNERGGEEEKDVLAQDEQQINTYDQKITSYLLKTQMYATNLSIRDTERLRNSLEVIKNLERVGDLCEDLTEFFMMTFDADESFSDTAMTDVNDMFDAAEEMLVLSRSIFETRNPKEYEALLEKERFMDQMEYAARQSHFTRMGKNQCTAVAGSIYCDILGTLERIGDHITNIGKSCLTENQDDISPDEDVLHLDE